MTREEWLHLVTDTHLRPLFTGKGHDVPVKVRIGVGWPSKRALSNKNRRIGEAWSEQCSEDQTHEIILSPCLADPSRLVDVLIHELVHVTVGIKHGHKKPFSACAKAVGLVKPWTATTASPELVEQITGWLKAIPAYPHGMLSSLSQSKPEGTRMLLLECEDCGLKIRSTQKWIDEYGPRWPCPCGSKLIHEA